MPQIDGTKPPPVLAADIRRVAIVGAGRVGHSIAQQFAAAGYIVSLQDLSDEHLERALRKIRDDLGQLESAGHLGADGVNGALSRIRLETDVRAAVEDADIVLEAVFEDLALKQSVFRDLDALAPARAILASNTSTFVPSELGSVTGRADRVLVAHWFNPPQLLPLVELVRGHQTSDATIETMRDLLRGIGKRPAIVEKETPGFVANRLQFALLREALFIVEQGIASPEDVDTIITQGFGRRLAAAGVFENFDLAGWDLILAIAEQVWPLIDTRPEVTPLLRERVERSERGVKDGQGFYAWSAGSAEELRQRIRAVLLAINDVA
jgi:3-hydroxybutyryl-CoA dehydrogenase